MYNIIQLNDKDLSELQSIAKELGITKTESLKKEELVYKILDEQAIVGATKKVAAAKVNEDRKENQPKKRSRISVKKEGDKVYTATKDKAQKLEAATPTTAAHIAEEAEKEAVSTVETAQPIQEKTVTEAVEKSEPKKEAASRVRRIKLLPRQKDNLLQQQKKPITLLLKKFRQPILRKKKR